MYYFLNGKTTGIYCIVNNVNEKRYVGSTSYCFKHRFYTHRYTLKNNSHHNIYLQRAWNKYGEKSFSFHIIEKVEKKDCLSREQWYLDNTRCDYNLCKIAGAPIGYRHGIEILEKMRQFQQHRKYQPNTQIVEVENKLTLEKYEFNTIKEAAIFLKMSKSTLSNVLCGTIKQSSFLNNFKIRRK